MATTEEIFFDPSGDVICDGCGEEITFFDQYVLSEVRLLRVGLRRSDEDETTTLETLCLDCERQRFGPNTATHLRKLTRREVAAALEYSVHDLVCALNSGLLPTEIGRLQMAFGSDFTEDWIE